MGILLTVPVWVIFMLIGTTFVVFYKQQPLPEGLRPEAVFPYFIKTRLPVGVVGLISSAILIGIFYVNAGSEGVLGIVFTLYAILSGGIVGIFLLGLFSARANRQG